MSEDNKFFLSPNELILKGVVNEKIGAVRLHYQDSMAKHDRCNTSNTGIHYHDISNPVSAGDAIFVTCNSGEDDDCQLCRGYSRKVIAAEVIEFNNKQCEQRR